MNNISNFIIEKLKINSKSKIEKDRKNWSIEKARDGDIIKWNTKNNNTLFFIYKCLNENKKYNKFIDENSIVYHAALNMTRNVFYLGPEVGVGSIENKDEYTLASDEECDKFYELLKNHNYIWDSVKLKLIKI